ncbi:MAG: sugar nucleotide-binding protein, partial [Rikenellaceae bacterium]
QESQRRGAAIVHISTDYVFKGDQPEPRDENDPVDPQSIYGKTKLEGEENAKLNPKHIILRTSWLYSIYGNNFVKTIRRIASQQEQINVVSDQWGSPTSAHDLAKAIIVALEKPKYGIYHFSNEGATSWAIFAQEIIELSGLDCKVNYITTQEYPTPAVRPEYSLMSKAKFTKDFKVQIAEWEASLEEVIQKLNKQS